MTAFGAALAAPAAAPAAPIPPLRCLWDSTGHGALSVLNNGFVLQGWLACGTIALGHLGCYMRFRALSSMGLFENLCLSELPVCRVLLGA